MSEFEKSKLYLDEFFNLKGMDSEISQKFSSLGNTKKIDIDLIKSEDITYNPFDTDNVTKMLKSKEVKTIIHDFYKKEYKPLSTDEGYREIIFKLYQHLGYKSQFDNFSDTEKILLHLIHARTYSLINEFKDVLKDVKK